MLSTIPIDLSEINKENTDKEILRAGIIAELDAINLYEQMASLNLQKQSKNQKKLVKRTLSNEAF